MLLLNDRIDAESHPNKPQVHSPGPLNYDRSIYVSLTLFGKELLAFLELSLKPVVFNKQLLLFDVLKFPSLSFIFVR